MESKRNSSKDFPFKKMDYLFRQSLTQGKNVQRLTPRTEQHFASSAYQTGTIEELDQGYGSYKASFKYLAEKFPGVNAAKIKEGVFGCPQSCRPLADEQINRSLGYNDRMAWNYLTQTTLCEITRLTIKTSSWRTYWCPIKKWASVCS
jgi:hypothetical protein